MPDWSLVQRDCGVTELLMDELELLPCPQRMIGHRCNHPAEVVSKHVFGEMEVVSIYCILGHVYSGPREFVTAP